MACAKKHQKRTKKLGFANFNKQFIEKYSKIIILLTDVTKKKVGFNWITDQQRAFEILKQLCANPPVFCTFRVGHPARIETNASDLTIRVCFCQQHDGKWKPVAYYSRKMLIAEQNYDIHDKKLLTTISVLQQWKVYVENCSELTIFTDHNFFLTFTTTKEFNKRQIRWLKLLGQYKFKIIYTPGRNNGKTNAFSRRSDHMECKNNMKTPVFKQKNDGFSITNQFAAILRMFITNVIKTFTKIYAINKLVSDFKK